MENEALCFPAQKTCNVRPEHLRSVKQISLAEAAHIDVPPQQDVC